MRGAAMMVQLSMSGQEMCRCCVGMEMARVCAHKQNMVRVCACKQGKHIQQTVNASPSKQSYTACALFFFK